MDTVQWLAGLLEGEGSFCAAPPSKRNAVQIALEMTDEDVVQRVAALLGARTWTPALRNQAWKQSYRTHVRGKRAAAWMTTLRPLMGKRRQAQIDAALATFSPDPTHFTVSPRPWPSEEDLLAMAATSSRRAIAKQLGISHQAVHARIKRLQSSQRS